MTTSQSAPSLLLMVIVDHDPSHYYDDLDLLASDDEETGSRLEDMTTEDVTDDLVAAVREAARDRMRHIDHLQAQVRLGFADDPYDPRDAS